MFEEWTGSWESHKGCEDEVTDPLEKPAGQTTQALGRPKGFGLCPRSWVAGAGELSNWCVAREAWPLRREWIGGSSRFKRPTGNLGPHGYGGGWDEDAGGGE